MTQAEFIPLAERYKDTVYRIALNYYGSPYDADDTVQDVMLKLFQREESFANENHARYWIIRVTINQCKNGLRWAQLRRHEDLDAVTAAVELQTPEQSEVYRQVMSLPERYRTALYLFYYEELTVNVYFGQEKKLKDYGRSPAELERLRQTIAAEDFPINP